MPIKLLCVLAVAIVAALFTGYNLDNHCDVWLFHTFENVPVAVTILTSLIAGVLITLPFTFGRRLKKGERIEKIPEETPVAQKAAKKEKKRREALPPVPSVDINAPAADEDSIGEPAPAAVSEEVPPSSREPVPTEQLTPEASEALPAEPQKKRKKSWFKSAEK